MHIPVSIPHATAGCDICFDEPSKVKIFALESTLNTVLEGNKTVALVVSTTANPIKLKQGVLLSHALAYDGQIVPEPLELSRACIGAVDHSSIVTSNSSVPASLDSLVKVMDYPEQRDSLFMLLHKYREDVSLPGESLGATDKAEHRIKSKLETKSVYLQAYRLPHIQRQIIDEQIKDMLKQGAIQLSRSPWNSPLFLVPKRMDSLDLS